MNHSSDMSLRCHSPTLVNQVPMVTTTSPTNSTQSLTTTDPCGSAAPTSSTEAEELWKISTVEQIWSDPQPEAKQTDKRYVRLEFKDFVDLQTRLILLPRVEEEGRGAVISNFLAIEAAGENPTTPQQTPNEADNSSSPKQLSAESSKEHRDDQETSIVHDSVSMEGCIFVGLESKQEDWKEKEFTEILASLREEKSDPISLVFEVPAPQPKETKQGESTTQSSPPPKPQTSDAQQGPQQDSIQSGMLALSAWGMRMRAQATEAATNLSSAAKEHARIMQQAKDKQTAAEPTTKTCGIFLQTSVGAFLPVDRLAQQSKITTSSLLLVRKSATEPAPSKGWSYQWYRSSSGNEALDETASQASRSSRSNVQETPDLSTLNTTAEEVEWVELAGATHAAFQPDATLVGRQLRCVVTLPLEDDSEPASSDSESESLDDVDLSSLDGATHPQVVCEVPSVLWADLALFNGARQSLVQGARFGGLKGRGNASGRQFRVQISIGFVKRRGGRGKPKACSSLQVFQMSGAESVTLTEKPILNPTAAASAANPKHLDLQFTVGPDSVLSVLCTGGVFQLETPNRLTRESILLALGIANFPGKPAELDAQTILFRDEPQSLVDDASFSSGSSCASSVRSNGSGSHASSVPTTPPRSTPNGALNSPPVNSSFPPIAASPISTNSSAPNSPSAMLESLEAEDRVTTLERELEFLRGKLTRKDKVVSELQRQVAKSDALEEQAQRALTTCREALTESKSNHDKATQSLQSMEKQLQSHQVSVQQLKGGHASQVATLEGRLEAQSTKIGDLEKANRSLQNDKAVLQAAVEARQSKLTRMGELQTSFDELSAKVAQQDTVRAELEASNQRYEDIRQDLLKVEQVEADCREELQRAKETIDKMEDRMKKEEEKAGSVHSQLDSLQKKNQLLRGERNNFKQKNDSLSKEIGRLCRNGRTIKDIEKMLVDHTSLLDEAESLRKQKREALENVHEYRTKYEQSKVAQQLSGVEGETRKALERNAELERLLFEMTEYVNAKDMQLETMKQVNDHLQQEIHELAQANLDKNEV